MNEAKAQVTDHNLAVARRAFAEIYGQGKIALVDQLYADDFVDDSPGGKGRDMIKEAVTGFHRAFPDLGIDIEDAFAVPLLPLPKQSERLAMPTDQRWRLNNEKGGFPRKEAGP